MDSGSGGARHPRKEGPIAEIENFVTIEQRSFFKSSLPEALVKNGSVQGKIKWFN
jgi:hypothetical protein